MSLSLRGGTHEVRIFKGGQEFNRSTHPFIFNSITNVEAVVGAGLLATIKVSLEPAYQDALKILESGLLGVGMSTKGQKPTPTGGAAGTLEKASKGFSSIVSVGAASSSARSSLLSSNTGYIAVKFLYPGEIDNDGGPAETPWFTGMLVQPDINMDATGISITINAMASAGNLAFIEGAVVFKNQTIRSIVETLASPMNLTVETENEQTEKKLEKKISWVANESKMQAIKNLLFKADCFFKLDSSETKKAQARLLITAREGLGDKDVKFTFVKFRQIDPANDVFPIFSLSLVSAGPLFLPGAAFGSFQRCVDESSKKTETLEVNAADVTGKSFSGSDNTGGTLAKGNPNFDGGGDGVLNTEDPEITGQANVALVREDADNVDEIQSSTKRGVFFGPVYNLQVPGLPRLQPLSLNQLIIGDRIKGISGVGLINKLTHTSGSEGWVSDIEFKQTGGLSDSSEVSNFANRDTEQDRRVAQSIIKNSLPF